MQLKIQMYLSKSLSFKIKFLNEHTNTLTRSFYLMKFINQR